MIARALTVACATLALTAPVAFGDSFDDVFHDYQADGRIDPCKHTTAQLQRARDDVPPDIEQYAPDFPDALDRAIEARARGRCAKRRPQPLAPSGPTGPVATTGVPAPPAASTTGPTGPTNTAVAPATAEPPAPQARPAAAPSDEAIARAAAHDRGDSDVPAPLLALAVLAGLLLIAGAAYGLTRWLAWEPPWALRARHAAGEAGWRVSATWAEFSDWLRFGR